MTRVDDTFIKELVAEGEDVGNLFAFTEAFEDVKNQDKLPVGLKKMKTLGLVNPIIEIDTLRQRDNMSAGEIGSISVITVVEFHSEAGEIQ